MLLERQQFRTSCDRHREYSGTMHTKVFSVPGLRLQPAPLFNASLFFRCWNTHSSPFFTVCQTLSYAPLGIISSEVGPLLFPVLQMRDLRQREVKHLLHGYFADNSGLTCWLTSLEGSLLFTTELPCLGALPWIISWTQSSFETRPLRLLWFIAQF